MAETNDPGFTNSMREFKDIATQLSDAYREQAMIRAQGIQAHSAAFRQAVADGQSITTCRELASDARAMFDVQSMKLQGEIDALLAQRTYVQQAIQAHLN